MKEKTFENVKEYFTNRGFKTHIAFQDTRADDGDDGSYGIFLTEANNKFYVQVIHLSCYVETTDIVACENDNEGSGFKDYVTFKTQQEAIIFIKRFMQTLFIFKTIQDYQYILNEEYKETLGLELYWQDVEDFMKIFDDIGYVVKDLKILDSIDVRTLCEWLVVCNDPFNDYPTRDIRTMNENFKALGYNDYFDFIKFDLHNLHFDTN